MWDGIQVMERWMQSAYLADILRVPGAAAVGDRGQCGAADLDECCITTEALRMVCIPHSPYLPASGCTTRLSVLYVLVFVLLAPSDQCSRRHACLNIAARCSIGGASCPRTCCSLSTPG